MSSLAQVGIRSRSLPPCISKIRFDMASRSASTMSAIIAFRLKFRPNLRTPGAPKVLRCLCGSLERCVSILCAHSDSRFDVRQTTAAGGSQDRGSRRFLVREFTNRHPIMVAEGQVPTDEFASNTFKEFGNRFLTIFWSRQHALDRVGSVPTTRDVDWHGLSPGYFNCSISCRIGRSNAGDHRTEFQPT